MAEANTTCVLIVSPSNDFSFLCRTTWKPPNMCAGCVWPDSSFIRLTRVACKCFSFLSRLAQFLSLCSLSSLVHVSSLTSILLSPPLSSERSVTPCLLRSPRSPFSLYPFLAFQCSLVPLCLLIRGEQHCQPPPTVWLSSRCQHTQSLPDCSANNAKANRLSAEYLKWALGCEACSDFSHK